MWEPPQSLLSHAKRSPNAKTDFLSPHRAFRKRTGDSLLLKPFFVVFFFLEGPTWYSGAGGRGVALGGTDYSGAI